MNDKGRPSIAPSNTPDIMSRRVDELELTVRAANCLKNDNIVFIRELVQKTPEELLRRPNMGRKSISVIESALAEFGLRLGMQDIDIHELQAQSRHLNMFVDIVASIKNVGIRDVDELMQLTSRQLADAPHHLDEEQIAIVEEGLAKWGLNIGIAIPRPVASDIVCGNAADNFREEILCIVKDIIPPGRENWIKCFISYYGLDGRSPLTLEEIGGRATDFGFNETVTRERVRQIIDKARSQITKRAGDVRFSLWDTCTSRLREIAPAPIASFVSICGYDGSSGARQAYANIKEILELFQVDFPFKLIDMGGTQFVIDSDAPAVRDIVDGIRDLPSNSYHEIETVCSEIGCDENILERIIVLHPRWAFLDDDRCYMWKKPTLPPVNYIATGNAILSSLCKIFSVTGVAKSRDLVESVARDKGTPSEIPNTVLEGIARRSGLFDVRDGKVLRKKNKQWFALGGGDRALVKICLEQGQIVRSDVIRPSLVRHGLSAGSASLALSYSPLLIHEQAGSGAREGIYRFVFSPEDVDLAELTSGGNNGSADGLESGLSEACVRIAVSSRVMWSDKHSMRDKELPDGELRVLTVEGAEVGTVTVSGTLVRGLRNVVSALRLGKGDVLELRSRGEEGAMVATKAAAGASALDAR